MGFSTCVSPPPGCPASVPPAAPEGSPHLRSESRGRVHVRLTQPRAQAPPVSPLRPPARQAWPGGWEETQVCRSLCRKLRDQGPAPPSVVVKIKRGKNGGASRTGCLATVSAHASLPPSSRLDPFPLSAARSLCKPGPCSQLGSVAPPGLPSRIHTGAPGLS